MSIQYGSQLHYRCCIDLAPKERVAGAWGEIVRLVRDWISKRCGWQEELGRRWFFVAGEWRQPDVPRRRVQTTSCIGNGSESAPELWALRYEHPCDDVSFRQWRTDIGVTALPEGRFRFVLATTHFLMPGYIGDEPSNPNASAPGIVPALIRSTWLNAQVGTQPLTVAPAPLAVGKGNEFANLLGERFRPPVVLLSLDFASKQPLLVPVDLSRLLAGAANVYVSASSEVDRELEWILPKHLRCWNGMARVYQPNAQLDAVREDDGRRHRYFTSTDIERRSASAVADIIVRGIVRRGRTSTGPGVATIEDVVSRQRERRIAQLRAESHGQPSSDWLHMLEDDNNVLNQKVKELSEKADQLEAEIIGIDDQNAALEKRLESLDYEKSQCQRRAQDAEEKMRLMKTQVATLQSLSELPDNLLQVVDLIERLHAGKIYFTARARKAADAASITDMWVAWKLLWAMATVLQEFHFGATKMDSASIEREFRAKTTFEMSLTEGKQTKADNRLMALRKDEWEGSPIDITPHVKWGVKEPKILRVHYCPHHVKKAIIVGHCGDHMDTSGTRKQK